MRLFAKTEAEPPRVRYAKLRAMQARRRMGWGEAHIQALDELGHEPHELIAGDCPLCGAPRATLRKWPHPCPAAPWYRDPAIWASVEDRADAIRAELEEQTRKRALRERALRARDRLERFLATGELDEPDDSPALISFGR